ncbi:MAG: sigma-54-dependent Fis family transcriptional regulator [Acidobacteriaceae bacterium]|nr:sigma-54-dependent Fis family transcriptional regulator [Acidobacteriaceae bacterium]
MANATVALVEEGSHLEDALRKHLESAGFDVLLASHDALDRVLLSPARLFIVANRSPDTAYAVSVLQRLHRARSVVPVFLLARVSSEQLAVAALKQGVADYFAPPIDLHDVMTVVRRATASRFAFADREFKVDNPTGGRDMIGESISMRELRTYVGKVAQRECNALILGETGTGKDLVAEAIHFNSPRKSKPFVSVNCAAIPDTLLESELFGYEKGAFTGADGSREGKIGQAQGGTLFLDEIGDMTPYAQAKILRVIESKQIQRLGGKACIPVNVRILAATNQNLPKLISEQRFRKDLYFRLNVAQIPLPSLRDRREDIGALLNYYVGVFNHQSGSRVEGFTARALMRLTEYDWPGNVRELRSMVESIFIDPPYPRIDECHLPLTGSNLHRAEVDDRQRLMEALRITHWNKSKAAARLRWSRMKVYRKLAQYRIEQQTEKAMSANGG